MLFPGGCVIFTVLSRRHYFLNLLSSFVPAGLILPGACPCVSWPWRQEFFVSASSCLSWHDGSFSSCPSTMLL